MIGLLEAHYVIRRIRRESGEYCRYPPGEAQQCSCRYLFFFYDSNVKVTCSKGSSLSCHVLMYNSCYEPVS